MRQENTTTVFPYFVLSFDYKSNIAFHQLILYHKLTVSPPSAVRPQCSCVPVVAQFDPDNLFVVRLLPRPAITAGPRPLRRLHLQTLRVEGSRACVAAQQLASYICMDVNVYVRECVCVNVCFECMCVCVYACIVGNGYAKRGGVYD